MAARSPHGVTVRVYDVGFGDCFLLSFHYRRSDRHVLIDFGSAALPAGKTVKGPYLNAIAASIHDDCGGRLHAVVATHRHRDHVNGFAREHGRGPGEIIRSLAPELVIRPWTDEQRTPSGRAPAGRRGFARSLAEMQRVAGQVGESAGLLRGERFATVREQLRAVAQKNTPDADALENLRSMATNRYVHLGSNAGLGRILPGVRTSVLGPATIEQTRSRRPPHDSGDDDPSAAALRFWRRLGATRASHSAAAPPLFPGHPTGRLPRSAGWFRYYAMQEQSASLVATARMIDSTLNDSSVMLLFEVGDKLLLFPGDAQHDEWTHALGRPGVREKLAHLNLYKVADHGSRSATPKSLWESFRNAGSARQPRRLVTLLSTRDGVRGDPSRKTEVPRRSLLRALNEKSDLVDTREFAPDELRRAVTMKL